MSISTFPVHVELWELQSAKQAETFSALSEVGADVWRNSKHLGSCFKLSINTVNGRV